MSTPDVTVIVPVYNTVTYLGACVDSLLAQTLAPGRLEVWAVDDGSTDGSGELLDDYARRHPDVVHVAHQPNSGGPARPCNAGLERARGRYVFFLGSDDYLAADALERLVTAADAWEADVVVPPIEGVNGRLLDQRLFQQEHTDLEFPGELLPWSLSNTKLYRRSLLEEHGIRFAMDLRFGSDQPFTIAAMRAARRIGVIARPTAYFAVKRDDDSNITFGSPWRTRLADIGAIVEHICEVLPAGDDRDAILARHFTWELDKLLRQDLPLLDDEEATRLVGSLRAVAERLLTDGVRSRLSVPRKQRWWFVLQSDVAALRQLPHDPPGRLLIEPGGAFRTGRGFRAGAPDWVFTSRDARLDTWVRPIDRRATLSLEGGRIVLRARAPELDPASAAVLQLALSPVMDDGTPRRPLDVARDGGTRGLASTPLVIDDDGSVRAELDPAPLAADGGAGVAGLRLRMVTDDRILDRPIRLPVDLRGGHPDLGSDAVRLESAAHDRVRVRVEPADPPTRGRWARLRRRGAEQGR